MDTRKTPAFARSIVFATVAALLVALAFSGCAGPDGVKRSPVIPVATIAANEELTDVIADLRSNGNVVVIRARAFGLAGLRDAYSGAWLVPPRAFEPERTLVWRRDPEFSQTYGLDEPLPAWVETEPGLWREGEAAALGYVFEAAP